MKTAQHAAKSPMGFRTKLVRAETKVLGSGRVSVVASDESPDRDGDIVRQSGWDMVNFLLHPVLLTSHDYTCLRSQIGEWEDMKVVGQRLVGVARYYIDEGNEEADWGWALASKSRAAYSVGFIPIEYGFIDGDGDPWAGPFDYIRNQLIEISHVVIPSNPHALQMALKSYLNDPMLLMIIRDMQHDGFELPQIDNPFPANDAKVVERGIDVLSKAGRSLSAANEAKIRSAVDMLTTVLDSIGIADSSDGMDMSLEVEVVAKDMPTVVVATKSPNDDAGETTDDDVSAASTDTAIADDAVPSPLVSIASVISALEDAMANLEVDVPELELEQVEA